MTLTEHDERVENAHIYLWRRGRRHPRPVPIPCETSFHGEGRRLSSIQDPPKIQGSLGVIGRRDRITEKAPKLRLRTYSLAKTES